LRLGEARLTQDEEQLLSQIIEDINAASGQVFDTDVATKAMLQIKDLLLSIAFSKFLVA
jgi:type I restriction enzyme R subunit